eukprot:5498994-Amphidinium_carterae.1
MARRHFVSVFMSSAQSSPRLAEAGDIETIPLRLLVADVGTGVRLPPHHPLLRAWAGLDCDDDEFILVGEQQHCPGGSSSAASPSLEEPVLPLASVGSVGRRNPDLTSVG